MNRQTSGAGHQLWILMRIGLRDLWQRPLYLAAVLMSFMFLAVIVTTLFSLREGLIAALESSAEPNYYYVQSNDAPSELSSTVTRSQAAQLSRQSGVLTASPEWVVLVSLAPNQVKKEYVIRGVTSAAFALKNASSGQPLLQIIAGRQFQPGNNELIVGSSLAQHYAAFRPGNTIRLRDRNWKIVGVFSSGGSPRQSEFITDLEHLRTSWGAGLDYNLLTFTSTADIPATRFTQDMEKSLRDKLTISSSREHYAGGSEGLISLLLWFSLLFSLLAAIAVTAGNIALSESLIANQQDQLAMMLLLGFGRVIGISWLCQIVLIGLVGSLMGTLLSTLCFSGMTFTTFDHVRELVFPLTVNLKMQLAGTLYGVLVSVVASLFVLPAIRHALKGK